MKILLAGAVAVAALFPMSAPAAATPTANCPMSGPVAGHRLVESFDNRSKCCQAGKSRGYTSYYCQGQGVNLFSFLDDPFDPYESWALIAKR